MMMTTTPPTGSPSAIPQENRRLLVVDDEPEIRRGYRNALNPQAPPVLSSSRVGPGTDSGTPPVPTAPRFEIIEAESGDQAKEILLSELAAGRRFAGAIVDVRMPGKLDGLQFIREAWKSDPGLLVVVATAYQDRSVDEIDRIFSIQFQDQWDYLNKPFTAGEIIQKARQVVSSWNRRERERSYLIRIQEQQQALIAQERLAAIGRLARSVGHEFGNVLQPMLTKLEILQSKVETALEPMVGELIESAELGSHICQDLLTFARENPDSSAPPQITLKATIDRALRILSHNLKKKDIHIQVAVPEELTVRCHEPRLAQVVINLIANSIDALPEGGEIKIEAGADHGGDVQKSWLSVTDNGCGVDPQVRDLVFQPLFTTKGARGNGLGLSVCKQIIENYGGKIQLEGATPRGTRVSFTLPA